MPSELVFVKITSAGSDTGPFIVYSSGSNGLYPLHNINVPFSKESLLEGLTFDVPSGYSSSIKVQSVEGFGYPYCTNSVISLISSTTTTTSTSTTSTTSTSTTTTTTTPALVPVYWNFIPYSQEEFNILGTNIRERRTTKIQQGNPQWVPANYESSGVIYVPYNTSITVVVTGRSTPIFGGRIHSEIIGYDRCRLQLIDYIDRDYLYSSYIANGVSSTISYSFKATISTGYSLYLGHYDNIPIY